MVPESWLRSNREFLKSGELADLFGNRTRQLVVFKPQPTQFVQIAEFRAESPR